MVNSMELYDILFTFSIVAIILFTFILMIVKPLKNKCAYSIKKDDLFKAYKDDYGYNYIYSTKGETQNFRNRYVLRVNHSTKTLICNYTKNFKQISYHVICLNRRNKMIKVFNANETNVTTKTSVIFLLPTNCKRVNVVIQKVDDVSYNEKIISPIPKSQCRLYTILSTINFLSFMYIIRYLIFRYVGGEIETVIYDNVFNYITLIMMLAMAFVYMLVVSTRLRKRNYRTKTGGSLEYEFF